MKRYRIFRNAPSAGRTPGPLQSKIVDLEFPPMQGEEVESSTPLTEEWADYVPEPTPEAPIPATKEK